MANFLQNRRQLLKKAGVLGAIAAVFSPVAAITQAHAQSNTSNSSLGGSWRVSVNPQGEGSPAPFQGLHTFSGDGAITTAEQIDLIPSNQMTAGHGSWVKLSSNDGRDDFSYHYQKLVVDANGNLLGTQIINVKIELTKDGRSFTGSGTSVFQPVAAPTPPDYVFTLSASRI